MANDFEVLLAAFASTGVSHWVFGPGSRVSGRQEEVLVSHHGLPDDVVVGAGGIASGINVNGVTMFFDCSGRYVGSSDTTRAQGPRFERPHQPIGGLGEGTLHAGGGVKDGE